ncbi:MAG: hypothetical protein ACOCR1_04140 [Planctomycetota bacterium]
MAAYIVGMIVGGLVTVFPLVYMMNYDRSLALILQQQPDFPAAEFSPAYSPALATGITTIGAVILLVSVGMMAFTGMQKLREDTNEPVSEPSDEKADDEATNTDNPMSETSAPEEPEDF